jgi:hypothetical protein
VILAAVLVVADLVVKNTHYAYCMTLEPGSWSWWLHGCFVYDSAPTAGAVVIGAAMAAYVAVQLWARRTQ